MSDCAYHTSMQLVFMMKLKNIAKFKEDFLINRRILFSSWIRVDSLNKKPDQRRQSCIIEQICPFEKVSGLPSSTLISNFVS